MSPDLLSYFAAHAPDNIPDWFQPEPPADEPVDPWKKWSEAQQTLWRRYFDSAEEHDRTAPVEYFTLKSRRDHFYDELKAWQDARDLHRYFTWRWFYAGRMCQHGVDHLSIPNDSNKPT